ncbi:MAG: TerC family protein [Alphaproteobacteria bacterium]|nr:TerC family protein [Alphaproteobacteria bacterium]
MPFDADLVAELTALATVVLIDITLAGDNAIVVGLAASRVPVEHRLRVIVLGIVVATACRIVFAVVATQLLTIIGLTLAGGILLLWVAWRMWRDLRAGPAREPEEPPTKLQGRASTRAALWQIVIADISMSLDNVLAVAGAARDHVWVLIVGLVLSVALMGAASGFIAGLIGRYRWLAYIGVVIVAYVAFSMIYRGSLDVEPAIDGLIDGA